jgi:hypothetical protein
VHGQATVEEVAGAERRVPLDEQAGELDVFRLDGPDDGNAGPRQGVQQAT